MSPREQGAEKHLAKCLLTQGVGKQTDPYRAAVKGAGAAQEEGEEGEFAAHFHHEGDQEIGVNPGRADAGTEEDVYAAWCAESRVSDRVRVTVKVRVRDRVRVRNRD